MFIIVIVIYITSSIILLRRLTSLIRSDMLLICFNIAWESSVEVMLGSFILCQLSLRFSISTSTLAFSFHPLFQY